MSVKGLKLFSIKRISLFFCFFLLFYLEALEVFGVKLAIIWKVFCVMTLLLVLSYFSLRTKKLSRLFSYSFLFFIVSLFNYSLFKEPVSTISESVKYLYVPIAFELIFWSMCFRRLTITHALKILEWIALFTVLSVFPFIFGFLEPLYTGGYDLEIFGLSGKSGFLGVFPNSHSAAIAVGFSLIVLMSLRVSGMSELRFPLFIVVVGIGCLSIVMTYARTGYLVLLVGLYFAVVLSDFIHRKVWFTVAASLFFVFVFIVTINVSDFFRMRFLGENIYTHGTTLDITSGRFDFWFSALRNYIEQDFIGLLFGMGRDYSSQLLFEKFDILIHAHNGFINILQYHGALGFSLYCIVLYMTIRYSFACHVRPIRNLSLSLLSAYMVQMFVQGERVFLSDVMFGIVIGLVLYCRTFQVKQEN